MSECREKACRIILASGSPRRRELLQGMGYQFAVCSPDVDENLSGAPEEIVGILAERKADAAAARFGEGIVIAADTLVALDHRALGKPRDDAQACAMLESLSGREHEVFTGLCVLNALTGEKTVCVERTGVTFRDLTPGEIEAYVATGEPRDKAGAYAIQGGAGAFVTRVDGSFHNVIGLPTERLAEILHTMLGC